MALCSQMWISSRDSVFHECECVCVCVRACVCSVSLFQLTCAFVLVLSHRFDTLEDAPAPKYRGPAGLGVCQHGVGYAALGHHLCGRGGLYGASCNEFRGFARRAVPDHHLMPALLQCSGHSLSHDAKAKETCVRAFVHVNIWLLSCHVRACVCAHVCDSSIHIPIRFAIF